MGSWTDESRLIDMPLVKLWRDQGGSALLGFIFGSAHIASGGPCSSCARDGTFACRDVPGCLERVGRCSTVNLLNSIPIDLSLRRLNVSLKCLNCSVGHGCYLPNVGVCRDLVDVLGIDIRRLV